MRLSRRTAQTALPSQRRHSWLRSAPRRCCSRQAACRKLTKFRRLKTHLLPQTFNQRGGRISEINGDAVLLFAPPRPRTGSRLLGNGQRASSVPHHARDARLVRAHAVYVARGAFPLCAVQSIRVATTPSPPSPSTPQVVGRTLACIQGPATSASAWQTIVESITNHRECEVELTNYDKSRRPFRHVVRVVPIDGPSGSAAFVRATSRDVERLHDPGAGSRRLDLAARNACAPPRRRRRRRPPSTAKWRRRGSSPARKASGSRQGALAQAAVRPPGVPSGSAATWRPRARTRDARPSRCRSPRRWSCRCRCARRSAASTAASRS